MCKSMFGLFESCAQIKAAELIQERHLTVAFMFEVHLFIHHTFERLHIIIPLASWFAYLKFIVLLYLCAGRSSRCLCPRLSRA
jgi:hypothetical protein